MEKKKKAFTLIELIISLAIIMIVIAAFSKVSFIGINTGMKNKQSLDALRIAQNEIEKTRENLQSIQVTNDSGDTYSVENYRVTKKVWEEPAISLYTIEIKVESRDANPVYLATKIFKKDL